MCRFLAYKGTSILLDELLYQPRNSLIRQSAQAHEAEEPLNGDGFGVGWYTPNLSSEPGLFVSVRPAWNDRNLRSLCRHVQTSTLFAHVRAASEGEVSEANCHPFQFKRFLFMHNGGIGGFQKLKRQMRRRLSDEIYDWVRGQTDSEHLFALFLENLPVDARTNGADAKLMADVLIKTIREIQRMKAEAGIVEACYVNCAVTDGDNLIAMRYVSDPSEKASTLYYSAGNHYECRDGVFLMIPGNKPKSVLIVSEKLTQNSSDWKEIPPNYMCTVDPQQRVSLEKLSDDLLSSSGAMAAGAETPRGFRPKRHK